MTWVMLRSVLPALLCMTLAMLLVLARRERWDFWDGLPVWAALGIGAALGLFGWFVLVSGRRLF
jgi:hypothetical protein